MTREEAIRWLEIEKSIIKEVPEKPQGARELKEALDMAIEALLQVRCNNCKWNDDVIEVVRCKYCRQYIPHDLTDDRGWCCEFKTLINEDDFCSRGERETNDRHNQTV